MTKSRTVASALGKVAAANTISSTGALSVAGVTMIDSAGVLPDSADASAGDMVMTSDSNELFISDGSVWYSIALINTNPYFTDSGTPESTYALSTEGSTTTVTLTAVDSEGIPITYSAITDSDFSGLATLSQDSSVFTITPLSEDSATTSSGTITFKASDGVNIATALSTFTLKFLVLNSNNTVLLAKASGNSGTNTSITDSSSNSHTVTATSAPQATSFSPYRQAGYSYYFDGNGDYITCGTPSDFEFATNTTAWNIETWIYPTSSTGVRIFTDSYTGAGDTISLYFGLGSVSSVNDGNGLYLGCAYYTGSTWVQYNSGDAVELNEWSHVAASYDGDKLRMFINGINVYESSSGLTWNTYTYDTAYIGRRWDTAGNNYFTGYMSDFKLVNGTAVYTTDFTAPTDRLTNTTNTQLLTCHLPYLADGSSSDRTLTISGNVSAKGFTPFDYEQYSASSNGGSVYFDGTDDRLSATASTIFGFDGDFTVEFWLYYIGGNGYKFFWVNNSGSGDYIGYGLNNNSLNPWIWNNADVLTTSTAIVPNTWQHHVVVRNGTTLTIYLDGKSIGSTTTSTIFGSGSQPFYIAFNGANDTQNTPGYFSDFKVVKGTANYTSNFTPPTSPLSSTSAALHIKGTDAKIYDASQTAGVLTLNGDAVSSTGQTKYASSSMYFDGTGDTVSISETPNLPDDFTVEFWAYLNTTGNCDFYGPTTTGGMYIDKYSGYLRLGDLGGGYNVRVAWSPSSSTWYHIAAVRSNGVTKLYVDGTELASAADTFNYPSTSTHRLGYFANGYLNGYLEDFRITKDLSRYPYILPKETLTAVSGTSLLTAHASSIIDGSSNSHSITTTGDAAVSTTFAPAAGMYSVAFDGTGDELTIADDASFKSFGTNDFTIECWCYPNTAGSGFGNYIWGDVNAAGQNNSGTTQCVFNSSSKFVAYVIISDTLNSITSTLTTPAQNWYHVALVRSGSTFTLFVNGNSAGTITSSTAVDDSTEVLAIGGPGAYDGLRFNGYISNYRIVKGTALYTSSFTPPTAELKA